MNATCGIVIKESTSLDVSFLVADFVKDTIEVTIFFEIVHIPLTTDLTTLTADVIAEPIKPIIPVILNTPNIFFIRVSGFNTPIVFLKIPPSDFPILSVIFPVSFISF
jgi:hypothetical protein